MIYDQIENNSFQVDTTNESNGMFPPFKLKSCEINDICFIGNCQMVFILAFKMYADTEFS